MTSSPASAPGPADTPAILVIDDDEISRALMVETLSVHGWRVNQLSSPIGATRLLDEEGIDVVVVDVEMSGLRGDKLARLFRENRRFAHVGVVLVSARDEAELKSLGASCGADRVVSKRNVRSNLLPAVRIALQASTKRRRDARAQPGTGPEWVLEGLQDGRRHPTRR
jgi:DNA-binding response OmpR family regulator